MAAEASHHHDRIIITIDGPAGTGKSTVAHRLAAALGLQMLDTGAMYRAVALLACEGGIDPADGPALAEAARAIDMHFDWTTHPPRLLLGDRDVSQRIRDMDVSSIVSPVAAQSPVRAVLVQQQRRIADAHPRLVTEGRDQGSVVFPNALVRFYLEADVAVRAERRRNQLADAGRMVTADEVVRDINNRDRIDSTRTDGPLTCPDGAVRIDTTSRTIAQMVDLMASIVRERLTKAGSLE